MDFKIDFGTQTLSPTVAATGPLYASVPGRAASLGGEEIVFYDERLDRTHVMTAQVLQAMDLCREFRTLDAHVAAIVKALPQLERQQAAVRRVLEGLRSQGLLVSDVTVLDGFEADATPRAAPFAGVFIRACNRPAQLERLLRSLLDVETRFGARRRHVVIDDSTDASAVSEHARLLRDFAEASGAPVSHVHREAWNGIVTSLCEAAPEHAAATRGLLARGANAGGGIGMNLALLLSAGGRLALLDDDFVLPLHRHPAYRPGLLFGRSGRASRAFAGVDAALAAGDADARDPFDLHLALCGETLAAVTQHADGCRLGVDELRGLDYSRTPTLRPRARVLATVNGHRGHSGAATLGWVYGLDPNARAELLRDAASYDAWLQDPAVWSGTARYAVSERGGYTPFAIDNTRLLPCTAPDGRGEDALFANLAKLAYPRDVVVDVPFAIGHVQETSRARRSSLAQADRPTLAHCFGDLVDSIGDGLVASDPASRLRSGAARLRDLAAAETPALQSYLREYLGHRRSQRVESLQRIHNATKDAPEAWRDDLRAQIEANGKSLTRGEVPRLAGWDDNTTAEQGAQHVRDGAGTLAAGLEAWPALWTIASERADAWLDGARVG